VDLVVFADYYELEPLIRRVDYRVSGMLQTMHVNGCGKTYLFLYNPWTGVPIIPRYNTCWEAVGKAVEHVRKQRKFRIVALLATAVPEEPAFKH